MADDVELGSISHKSRDITKVQHLRLEDNLTKKHAVEEK